MLELLDYVFQKHFPNGGFLLVSLNPQAIAWLKLHPEHIDLEGLALNTHPEAIPLLYWSCVKDTMCSMSNPFNTPLPNRCPVYESPCCTRHPNISSCWKKSNWTFSHEHLG